MPDEPNWLLILVYLGAGFLLLMKGADWLVGGSSQIARRIGISTLAIGLTVVAFGTSAPEIVVSAVAASQGKVDLSLGNVLGSNIANIGLVLGASAVVLPKVLESRLPVRETFWVFASIGILWWVSSDRVITRMEAFFLLASSGVFYAHLWMTAREGGHVVETVGEYKRPWIWVILGILAISFGARFVVQGAEQGAAAIGIPTSVVGLTIVAIGTSLPELAAGVGGAMKGESDISLGNVVGSNVFNLISVVGIVAVIQPFDPTNESIANPAALDHAFDHALREDFWVVLGFSLAAIFLPRLGGARAGRVKGAVLVISYVFYCAWLYGTRSLS